jgi:hypothetical protein
MDQGGDLMVLPWDVAIFDGVNTWSPSLNASGRNGAGVGGWEVMMVQLASGLAARGYSVIAFRPQGSGVEGGVDYRCTREDISCRALVVGRWSSVPEWIKADVIVCSQVDDPAHEPFKYEHLIGRKLVCLSEWQAEQFRRLGHQCVVIPSMIDDWIYELPPHPNKRGFVCVNAWNKGTDATLKLWHELRLPGPFSVGSPYGAPADAAMRCRMVGATWLGQLKPREIVLALRSAEGVIRVCERPETFGVADAIAEAVGTPVYGLFTHGFGASTDVLDASYLTDNPHQLREWLQRRRPECTWLTDYRVSTIIPQWERLLELEDK